MFQWKKVHLVFAVYCLLISAGAFVAALYLFLIPTEFAQRWMLIGGMVFAGIFTLGLSIKAYQNHAWAEQVWFFLFKNERLSKIIRYGSFAGFIMGGFISLMPAYRLGNLQGYLIRLSPWIVWFVFVCLLTYLLVQMERHGLHWQPLINSLRAQKNLWGIAFVSMIVFALIWILAAQTGLGIRVYDDYWYGAGVPILGLQVVLAFSIGTALFFLERSSFSLRLPARMDFVVFALIWGVAAFLWAREPLPSSYFATGPDLPAGEFYPFSDAATFDLGSQFALIGQGMNNGLFFDRVLYMFFLLFLHVVAGQNYLQVVALQAAIFAVFPAILYLLGKALHSRSFGVILAVLATLRGINGIAASEMIDLANQKQMLTDFPVVIFAAWFALMAVKWLQSPNKNYLYALWAGGAVGLAVMLRTHVLFLLVFAILLAVIVYWNQKLRGVLISVLLIAVMFVVTLPWGLYSGESVFDVYMVRIRNVIEQRYDLFPQSTPTPEPQSNQLDSFRTAIQENVAAKVDLILSIRDTSLNTAIGSVDQEPPVYVIIASHFLHNLIMSALIMPTSPVFHDLRNTLKEVTPFWILYWDGSMGFSAGIFLSINLLLIALGIGLSWKLHRLAGLVPLGMFLFYNMANALAQTSGGRYIVPVDWVIFLYFALGLFQVILWGMSLFGYGADAALEKTEQHTPWTWQPLKRAPWIMLVFLMIGASMPLSEKLFPKQYPVRSQAELFTLMEQEGYLQQAGFDRATLDALSAQWPAFRITAGRALYPRYYAEGKGEPKDRYPYGVLEFPRIAFTMIGPDGLNFVLLPKDEVSYFPNASDVIVIGCQENIYMDALVVVVIEEDQVVYIRQPASPLQCPLQQPVCDNNHVCR